MAQPTIGAQASRLARDITVTSSSGAKTTIPKLIYGTAWKKEKTDELVYTAIKNGFRGIDTAAQPKHYDERGVGSGIKRALTEGIISREDLFIQTKFTSPAGQNDNMPYTLAAPLKDKVRMSVDSSFANLLPAASKGQYIDSLVMHSPLRTMQETLEAWSVMSSYHPDAVRNLGISNVTLPILKELCRNAGVKPTFVQNRFYAETGHEAELRAFCKENGIIFQSFWTLTANPRLARSQTVARVAQGAGVQSVAAYYCLVLGLEGVTVLDGTSDADHMKEDLEGIEKVGIWAEGEGKDEWGQALLEFKGMIGES